jgi:hypothetical protein
MQPRMAAPAGNLGMIQQLAQIAANPYLGEGQRMVAQALIQQQLQGMDPMQRIQMERAQLELERLRNPTPAPVQPDWVVIDGQLVDRNAPGGPAVVPVQGFNPPAPGDDMPDAVRTLMLRAEAAGLAPGTPEYQEFMRTGGSASANAPVNLQTVDLPGGGIASFNPRTGELTPLIEGGAQSGFRQATPEEAAAYGAAAGQFGPDGRFYPINPPASVNLQTLALPGGGIATFDPRTGQLNRIYEGEDVPDSIVALRLRAQEAGLAPGTQGYQEFMRTGGSRAPETNVTVNAGADQFNEAFARGDAAALATISEAGIAARRNIGRINQLEQMLQNSPTGFAGAAMLLAGEWGINTEGLDQVQAAQALINSLVPEQRQPGSGSMSDSDLELFKQSLPRIINQPGGNQRIIDTMRAIAEYDAAGAEIVQRVRSGQLTRAQGFEALMSRPNPLDPASTRAAAQGQAAPSGTITPATIGAMGREELLQVDVMSLDSAAFDAYERRWNEIRGGGQ